MSPNVSFLLKLILAQVTIVNYDARVVNCYAASSVPMTYDTSIVMINHNHVALQEVS